MRRTAASLALFLNSRSRSSAAHHEPRAQAAASCAFAPFSAREASLDVDAFDLAQAVGPLPSSTPALLTSSGDDDAPDAAPSVVGVPPPRGRARSGGGGAARRGDARDDARDDTRDDALAESNSPAGGGGSALRAGCDGMDGGGGGGARRAGDDARCPDGLVGIIEATSAGEGEREVLVMMLRPWGLLSWLAPLTSF